MSRSTKIHELKKMASQNSFELDATKLLKLITADDNSDSLEEEVKISRHTLGKISRDLNLSDEELDIIFAALDSDEDGYITSSELRDKVHSKNTLVFEKCPDEVSELGEDLNVLRKEWFVFLNRFLFFLQYWVRCMQRFIWL